MGWINWRGVDLSTQSGLWASQPCFALPSEAGSDCGCVATVTGKLFRGGLKMGLGGVQEKNRGLSQKGDWGPGIRIPVRIAGGVAGGPIAEACSQVFLHLGPLSLSGVKRALSKLSGVVRQCPRHGGHTRRDLPSVSTERTGAVVLISDMVLHGALPLLTIGSQPSFFAVASARYSTSSTYIST